MQIASQSAVLRRLIQPAWTQKDPLIAGLCVYGGDVSEQIINKR